MFRAIINWWSGYAKADVKSATERFHTQTILAASKIMAQIQKEGHFQLYAICEICASRPRQT
jgi:hypothetical protein